MCTRFEAREENFNTSDNETKCGRVVGKQLIASEYHMCQGTMDSLNYDCEYCQDRDRRGNQSGLIATNRRNGFSGMKGEYKV